MCVRAAGVFISHSCKPLSPLCSVLRAADMKVWVGFHASDTHTHTHTNGHRCTHMTRQCGLPQSRRRRSTFQILGGVTFFFQWMFAPLLRHTQLSPSSGDGGICFFMTLPSEGNTAVSLRDTGFDQIWSGRKDCWFNWAMILLSDLLIA